MSLKCLVGQFLSQLCGLPSCMVFFCDLDKFHSRQFVVKDSSFDEHVQQLGHRHSVVFFKRVVGLASTEILEHSLQLGVLRHDAFSQLERFLQGLMNDLPLLLSTSTWFCQH